MIFRTTLVFMLPLVFLAGCVTRDTQPTAAKLESSVQIVRSFVAEVSALAGEFPELAEFSKRNPATQTQTEVRFSQGLGRIKEMRGVRARDLEAKGIDLHFLVRPKDNPVWTEYSPNAIIPLDALGMDLYSGFVLSKEATPDLDKTLAAILERHRQLLIDLDKKAANK